MSFGFSVGDIILVSQLSYKLYKSVTEGRKTASKDIKELENVLFSLSCALEHLGNVANDISSSSDFKDVHDVSAPKMRLKLDSMVRLCAETLGELDTITRRYREAVHVPDNDGDTTMESAAAESRIKKRAVERFKVNWWKIRWDMERHSLNEYREKLQAHTDAINILLNTFLWKATHQIQTDNDTNTKKMHELQNQALQSNQSLLKLVEELKNMLLDSKRAPTPKRPPQPPPTTSITHHETASAATIESLHHLAPHQPRVATAPISAKAHISAPLPREREPPVNVYRISDTTLPLRTNKPTRRPNLPREIKQLNQERSAIGSYEFQSYRDQITRTPPPPKQQPPAIPPSFLKSEVPTASHLHEGLTYIFSPFPDTTNRQATLKYSERKDEFVRWLQGLDRLLNSWISQEPGGGDLKPAQQEEMVDLLVRLNASIEKSDDPKMKREVYKGAEEAGVENMLGRVQTFSRSVRVMKEVEEFKDEIDGWNDSQADQDEY